MAAAVRDLEPATFDPSGDCLPMSTELQMTSLVGMVDPPRAESAGRGQMPRRPTSGCEWSRVTT